jgi:hypothetical protein
LFTATLIRQKETLSKSQPASQPLHQVVNTTKHPSDSFSQQNKAEEATEGRRRRRRRCCYEEWKDDDDATEEEKRNRYERSERSSVCDGRAVGQAGRRGGRLVPRAAEEQEQESTAATHPSSLCTSPCSFPLITYH